MLVNNAQSQPQQHSQHVMGKQICWPNANQVLILLCKQRERERDRERCKLCLPRFPSSLLSVQQLVMETLHMQMRAGRQRQRERKLKQQYAISEVSSSLAKACMQIPGVCCRCCCCCVASGKWSLCGNQIIKCWTWLVMAANWQQLRENFRRFQFSSGRQSDLSHAAQTSDVSLSLFIFPGVV